MSKNLDYAIIVFLMGILVILFRWSEKDKYSFYIGDNPIGYVFNPDTGETWYVQSWKTSYVLDNSISGSAGTALKAIKRLK